MPTFERKFAFRDKRLSRLLVRISTITQRNSLDRACQFLGRQLSRSILFPKVSTDRLIVGRRHLERLQGQLTPHVLTHIAIPLRQRFQELGIISGIREYRYALVVFCCCTEECHASDVDFFDCVSQCAVWLGNRGCKWVEIAHNDGDRRDALAFQIFLIGRDRTGQDAYIDRILIKATFISPLNPPPCTAG
jgi:hypothetical protein